MKTSFYVIIALLILGSALYCGYQWGVFTYTGIVLFIILLSWFLHREMKSTLIKSGAAEKELREERDALEIRIQKKSDELRQSELSRMYEFGKVAEFGRLSQGLFHDLLSPLAGLALHMEQAKNFTPQELEKSYASLTKIAETSRKMNETLEHLRGHLVDTMPARECSVRQEIEHVLGILKFKTHEKEVYVSINEKDPCRWFGDPVKIHQVFSNILSNALDAFEETCTHRRSIDILIERDGAGCKVEIRDNGIGMRSEVLEKIFIPYFTTKAPEKGSGVGLSIVRKALEEIGGEIKVKSTPGVGSTFTVIIQ